MNKSDLKMAVDFVLNGMHEHTLLTLLKDKTGTIYYLATLKNKVHKNPFGIYGIMGCGRHAC